MGVSGASQPVGSSLMRTRTCGHTLAASCPHGSPGSAGREPSPQVGKSGPNFHLSRKQGAAPDPQCPNPPDHTPPQARALTEACAFRCLMPGRSPWRSVGGGPHSTVAEPPLPDQSFPLCLQLALGLRGEGRPSQPPTARWCGRSHTPAFHADTPTPWWDTHRMLGAPNPRTALRTERHRMGQ